MDIFLHFVPRLSFWGLSSPNPIASSRTPLQPPWATSVLAVTLLHGEHPLLAPWKLLLPLCLSTSYKKRKKAF